MYIIWVIWLFLKLSAYVIPSIKPPQRYQIYTGGATIQIRNPDEYLSMDIKNINLGLKPTRTPQGMTGTNTDIIDTKNLPTAASAPVMTNQPVIQRQEPVNPNSVTEQAEKDDDACCPENITKKELIIEILTWTAVIIFLPVWCLGMYISHSSKKPKRRQ